MTVATLRARYSVTRPSFGPRTHRLAAFAAAWVAALIAVGSIIVIRPLPSDALAYWSAWHGPLYAGEFIYPPPGALLFAPAAFLSFPAFAAALVALSAAAGAWLLWPLRPALRIPLFIALAATFAWGNAATLLAVPLALAPRWPPLWSLLAWTKVTPAVGAVSLVRQRRWRDLALLAALCILIGLATVALAPDAVAAWLAQLGSHAGVPSVGFLSGPPLPVRIAAAGLIAWWGASRPWTLAVAAAVATPDLSLATFGLLAAVPRLRRSSRLPHTCQPGRRSR